MILGVLPLFITTELGASKAILGLIEGAAEGANYSSRVLSGLVSDRLRRRKSLVLLGYAFSTVAKPLFAFATSWPHAFTVRVMDRIGKGVRTSPRDALISESVKTVQAGRAFGLHRSLDQIGAILGPTFAFLLIPFIGIRGLFWLSFLPGAAALVVLLLFVKDIKGAGGGMRLAQGIRRVMSRHFIYLLGVLGLFAVGAFNFSFILVKASDLGVPSNQVPLVYAVINLGTVIVGLPAGFLADKFGKEKTLMLSFLAFLAMTMAGLSLTSNPLYAFPLGLLFGFYLGMSETVQRALIPAHADKELKGTAYGIYYFVIAACSLVANFAFGALWDTWGPSAAFGYSLITTIVAIVALLIFLRVTRPRH